jgi:hypothetical protein
MDDATRWKMGIMMDKLSIVNAMLPQTRDENGSVTFLK